MRVAILNDYQRVALRCAAWDTLEADVTEDTYAVFFADALEDIEAWSRGEPVRVLA